MPWRDLRCGGRAERIRTSGLLVPNQALYRAKLPPDFLILLTASGSKTALHGIAWFVRPTCLRSATASRPSATTIMWPGLCRGFDPTRPATLTARRPAPMHSQRQRSPVADLGPYRDHHKAVV